METIFNDEITVKKFTKFVTPSVIMLVFMAMYYIIDSIFVSNIVGSDALAAVNIVYPICGLGWGISVMLAAGSSAIVAIKMGEGNEREANEKFTLICIVSTVLSVIFVILGLLFLDELLSFLGSTEKLGSYCIDYAKIILLGIPGVFLGVVLEYFIRIDGRPGFTLLLYTLGGAVNIILDYLFIAKLHFGVSGAAWATVAGQYMVMIIGILYFIFQNTRLKLAIPKLDIKYIKDSIVNGSSEMVSESSAAIIIFMFNIIALGFAGEDGVAAISIVINAHYLLISIHLGFITGVAPLISYYFGAKDYGKLNVCLKYCKTFMWVASLGVSLLCLIGAPIITRIYVEYGSEVYFLSVRGVRFLSVAFLFTGINVFASGFFTAYANGKISAVISLSRGLIMVVIGAAILPFIFGIDGIWLAITFAEATTLVLSLYMFKKYKDVYHYTFFNA
ncbi:MATE family efflux transporter [Anaerovorax odorimutans]|uniref:MATE family efflux transporter n=1 Tax=Anaerovorax odorimutans TaxID=109327 RepID=UPI000422E427|nr:MATE family efflux transporter [Anaerovorax odorimutans]